MKKRFTNFRLRLKVCCQILFKRHWMVISLSDKDLEFILEGKEFDIDAHYLGLQKYIINKMISGMAEGIDSESLLMNRMEFEHLAEQFSKN